MRAVPIAIRWILTAFLTYKIYDEAGPYTGISFALVAAALELQNANMRHTVLKMLGGVLTKALEDISKKGQLKPGVRGAYKREGSSE